MPLRDSIAKGRRSGRKALVKRAYHHGNLRQAIIDAALHLVAERGARGFALSEAAKLAGVSVAAPYRHFTDREALLATIAEEGFSHLLSRLEDAASRGRDGFERLMEMGVAYVLFAIAKPAHFAVMFDADIQKQKFPGLVERACATSTLFAGAVHQCAETAHRQGGGIDESILTMSAWALVHGLAILTLQNELIHVAPQQPTEAVIRSSLHLLIDKHLNN